MSRRDRDDDSDLDDERPSSKPKSASSVLITMLRVFGLIAWIGLFVSITLGGMIFCVTLSKANGAPQEAAAGAIFSTFFIGLYILVRCIEKIIAMIDKPQTK